MVMVCIFVWRCVHVSVHPHDESRFIMDEVLLIIEPLAVWFWSKQCPINTVAITLDGLSSIGFIQILSLLLIILNFSINASNNNNLLGYIFFLKPQVSMTNWCCSVQRLCTNVVRIFLDINCQHAFVFPKLLKTRNSLTFLLRCWSPPSCLTTKK